MPIQFGPNVVIAGRFRLNRQLGRGGMGSVWHATHLGLDVPCAVKFIEGEIAALPEAQARFEREAKAAAQLRSPNVVQILDHGVYEGLPYIAMELLEGEDLGKRLSRIGRMSPYELVRIVNQVTRALAKAHQQGVVHRDLKPDNIFLVRDEDREIAKVLDFGIAKAQASNSLVGSTTKTGAMLGTPYYMSPEQAQGTKAVDHRSDLWSLGVIVFQALTGRLPFESEALGDLLIRIIVAPIPMPSEYVNDLPPAFDRWWQKASQREPANRWQSAKELAEGLGLAFGLTPGASVVEAPLRASYPMMGDSSFPAAGPPTGPNLGARATPHGAAFGQTPGFAGPGTPAPGMPFGLTPSQPGVPMPGFGATPHPSAVPPGAFGHTPPGMGASQPGGPGVGLPTTGTPLSRSVIGGAGIPKHSRTGLWVGLGVGGLLLAGLAVAGVSVAMKGKHATSADVPAVAESAGAGVTSAGPSVSAERPVAPVESSSGAAQNAGTAPQATASATSASLAPSATASTATPTTPKPSHPTWQPTPQPPKPASPPAQPKPASNKPKPVDLGI